MYRPYLTCPNIRGILIVVFIVGALLFSFAMFPYPKLAANWGFGPQWNCFNPGRGEPVCIRHP